MKGHRTQNTKDKQNVALTSSGKEMKRRRTQNIKDKQDVALISKEKK